MLLIVSVLFATAFASPACTTITGCGVHGHDMAGGVQYTDLQSCEAGCLAVPECKYFVFRTNKNYCGFKTTGPILNKPGRAAICGECIGVTTGAPTSATVTTGAPTSAPMGVCGFQNSTVCASELQAMENQMTVLQNELEQIKKDLFIEANNTSPTPLRCPYCAAGQGNWWNSSLGANEYWQMVHTISDDGILIWEVAPRDKGRCRRSPDAPGVVGRRLLPGVVERRLLETTLCDHCYELREEGPGLRVFELANGGVLSKTEFLIPFDTKDIPGVGPQKTCPNNVSPPGSRDNGILVGHYDLDGNAKPADQQKQPWLCGAPFAMEQWVSCTSMFFVRRA